MFLFFNIVIEVECDVNNARSMHIVSFS